MKKFINNLQILAMIALVPAMVIAYLGSDNATAEEKEKTEVVRKSSNIIEVGNMIQLVKSF
ncbi:hypothetical protein [Sediminibacterium goheungense]|uniref:Uncharacterized protein n=1 Tax=Sediminibacterium goheungense TaxID=1086393 RepID=A0A4R6J057_9BACT|nr:hypothetical protein [Sediminibacterium goheungense]TDO28177.1 hypothetical protein BC659_0239 [Sediminibacterium goheungense]